MAEHEPCVGASDEWYTPPEIFNALGLEFDLDPSHPGLGNPYCAVPARRFYTASENGLRREWTGLIWLNPPFGGRNGQVPWLQRFLAHGNGIALVAARTSAAWFHDEAVRAHTMLFPKGKTKFVRGVEMISYLKDASGKVVTVTHAAGSRGKSPGSGVVLLGVGQTASAALMRCDLGFAFRAADVTPSAAANAESADG